LIFCKIGFELLAQDKFIGQFEKKENRYWHRSIRHHQTQWQKRRKARQLSMDRRRKQTKNHRQKIQIQVRPQEEYRSNGVDGTVYGGEVCGNCLRIISREYSTLIKAN